MSVVDNGRVERARERLESATRQRTVDGLRIVKINAPVPGGEPIPLNRKLTILRGLSSSGLRTIYGTIDGMRRDAGADKELGISPAGPDSHVTTSIDPGLEAVVERCEQAIMLTEAEIRGAFLALEDLDASIHDSPAAPNLIRSDEFNDEFVPFIKRCVDVPSDSFSIEAGLDLLRSDPVRTALVDACSNGTGQGAGSSDPASGAMLFGGGNAGSTGVDHAEAEGALSEYDMAPGSPAYVLASRLEHVGISTSPLDAATVASSLLSQIEIAAQQRIEFEAAVRDAGGEPAETIAERDRVRLSRSETQRRLHTLKHLHSIARNQLADEPARFSPIPLMLIDPFLDIPSDLAEVTLSMLLRRTASSQVIVASDNYEARKWCETANEDSTLVHVEGWFAQEHDRW